MGVVTWQDNTLLSYDEWLLKRLNSIGASEVAAIVVGNKYTSNLEIFYAKIGMPQKPIENLRMFIGKETEELSSKLWKFYDGTEQSIVRNVRNNTPVKDCVDLKATAFNSDYPHLSVTPDRKILPVLQYAGMGEGALEIKNSQQMVLDSYVGGVPTDNIYQIITQMMVTGWSYGELFYFLDNRKVKSFFIKRRDFKKYEDTIATVTADFWRRVKLARPLYNQLYEAKKVYNMKLAAELEYAISELEPEPQHSDGYLDFITERYKEKLSGAGTTIGTNDQLLIAKKHKELSAKIKKLEKQQQQLEIELKLIIKDSTILDFGKAGKLTYFPNKNGDRRIRNLTT